MNPRLFDADCDLRLKYAGVYVLGNPYCVDGLYDYEIPCEMGNGAVVPGSFVTVPFGHRNQTRVALIAEVRRDLAIQRAENDPDAVSRQHFA